MKTIIFREGDKGVALCDHCRGKVTTTYVRRDVPLSDGSATVSGVLVGACDTCDAVVVTPPQSTPRVNRVVQEQRQAIETRVPAHLKDMLLMVNSELHQPDGFEQMVIRYYIRRWAERGAPVQRIYKCRRSDLFAGQADARLSFKMRIGDHDLDKIRENTDDLQTNTDLIKVIAMTAYEDVIEKPKSQARAALEVIAATCA